jgi:hypothetical protein
MTTNIQKHFKKYLQIGGKMKKVMGISILKMVFLLCLLVSVAIDATTYAVDVTPVPQGTRGGISGPAALKKLPSTIKINPNDVIMKPVTPSAQFNAEWKKVSDAVAEVNNGFPPLEQKIAILNIKIQECKNKVYTTADMTSAGCTDDASIAVCSKYLYLLCIKPEWVNVSNTYNTLHSKIDHLISLHQVDNALKKFQEWYKESLITIGIKNP